MGKLLYLEGQIPKKGLRRHPGLHKPKTGQFYLQLTYELVSLVFKLPQIPYKNLQKAPGPPKLKRDITHWLGGWLAGSGCFGSILGGTITKVPTLSLNQLAKSSPFFQIKQRARARARAGAQADTTVYVCMYVCVYVGTYVRMHVHMYVCKRM